MLDKRTKNAIIRSQEVYEIVFSLKEQFLAIEEICSFKNQERGLEL
jgi:hypothetical protein